MALDHDHPVDPARVAAAKARLIDGVARAQDVVLG